MKLALRVTGLLPLLIGIYLVQYAGTTLLEAYGASRWPSVPGKIVSSKVASTGRTSGDVPIARVKYAYQVNGTSYTSTRISHNDYGSNIEGQQEGIVARYPPGASVTVHYNPADPASAILESRIPFVSYITLAGGLVFLLVGYFIIVHAPRMLGRGRAGRS